MAVVEIGIAEVYVGVERESFEEVVIDCWSGHRHKHRNDCDVHDSGVPGYSDEVCQSRIQEQRFDVKLSYFTEFYLF